MKCPRFSVLKSLNAIDRASAAAMDAHASRSRLLIWRSHYRKRAETQLSNRHRFTKTKRKEGVDRPSPMEIDEGACMPGNIDATIKHSRTGASKFGRSPLNLRTNSAIHVVRRPARNNISPLYPDAVIARGNFCSRGRTRRRRNEEYSMELDGEIEMQTSHEGNPKADFPLIISQPPDINLTFSCLRRWDECTHTNAPCSPSPAGKSSVPFREFDSDFEDDCDSMDIDSEYDAVYRALLEDIEKKLGALDL